MRVRERQPEDRGSSKASGRLERVRDGYWRRDASQREGEEEEGEGEGEEEDESVVEKGRNWKLQRRAQHALGRMATAAPQCRAKEAAWRRSVKEERPARTADEKDSGGRKRRRREKRGDFSNRDVT